MLVIAVNAYHDGAVAVVQDRSVLFSVESEKDSFVRHEPLTPMTTFGVLERLDQAPDVLAICGHIKSDWELRGGNPVIEAGYYGGRAVSRRSGIFCGKPVTIFSGSHVRSHIMGAAGMAPPDDAPLRAVLIWEGGEGAFFLLDEHWEVVREIPVLQKPGARYSLLFAIADPAHSDYSPGSGDDSGKLMALAAYGDPSDPDPDVERVIDGLLRPDEYKLWKSAYADAPFYNAGVEADITKAAAALLQHRMFDLFAGVAQRELPRDIPLYIAGGCGLNCDWNTMWRELGHFSSVFVPPCANDTGTALGTAIDALHALTGDPRVDWDAYTGLEFEWDLEPDGAKWERRRLEEGAVADALATGRVFAWVQGRYEMGPRALGNRSLLAEPFRDSTRDRLNHIKLREDYRPIAPCARIEDVDKVFDRDFHDPHMLYFRMVTTPDLGAITHVDGSARVQTVTQESNKPQHDLLTAFAERHGIGVLCNTSLNYKGKGFINRMSDLADYCESRGVSDMVVGDAWFERVEAPVQIGDPRLGGMRLVRRLIMQHVPEGATVLVMSEGMEELVNLKDRSGWHFPQNEDGSFQGERPADSEEAIAKLERLRDKGASHLAIPSQDFWWLELYDGFRRHLEDHYHEVLRDDDSCMIFALTNSADSTSMRARS
jgi:hydroxymethyl cephem carbamoyltransferase